MVKMYQIMQALGVQENLKSRENPLGLISYGHEPWKALLKDLPSEKETKDSGLESEMENQEDWKQFRVNPVLGYAMNALTATAAAAVFFLQSFFPSSSTEIIGHTWVDGHYQYTESYKIRQDDNHLLKFWP